MQIQILKIQEYDADEEIAEHQRSMQPFFDQACVRRFPEEAIFRPDLDYAAIACAKLKGE